MKKTEILWNADGWTALQDADSEKHRLGITCRAENGTVVEVRIRHNDGEETKGTVLLEDKPALPMALDAFKKNFLKGNLDIH